MNIAVFISGTSTNLEALLNAKKENYLKNDIVAMVSNKNTAGLDFAREFNVDTLVSKNDEEIIKCLKSRDVDLIVLVGFLSKTSKRIINGFTIVNIHLPLLLKYGGKGCYGTHVHEKAFTNKEKAGNATMYLVNGKLGDENILLQGSADTSDCKSEDEMAKKTSKVEHGILKDAIKKLEESPCTC